MIKILFIPDLSKFLKLIDRCNGPVLLHLQETDACDLKQDPVARNLLELVGTDHLKDGLQLSLTNCRDAQLFLQYMIEARTPTKR